jgi:hypothetical protein
VAAASGRRAGLLALAVYGLLALCFWGIGPLVEGGTQYVGVFDDPQIPIWSFAWWLHAIEHGANPLYTHEIWAPTGVDLAWVNTVPPVALLFAPLSWLLGPVAAYDVAAVLLPAVSAWTTYLLCRHLTGGRFWPSLVGGYLFGFSSYVLGHVLGQPQLTAVFAMPLVALVLARAVEGAYDRRGVVLRLAPLLALQLYLSLEVALTLTLVVGLALVLGFLLAPPYRRTLVHLLVPVVLAYAVAAVLAAPILYYALTDLRITGFTPPGAYTADVLNFFLPTHLEAVGAGWAHALSKHWSGNSTEQGAFVGVPLLVMVVLYARTGWRTLRGRFLLVALAVTTYLSLGPHLHVAGHSVIPLPTVLGHEKVTLPGVGTKFLPLFDNILPVRFVVYASLAGAVIVALWMTATRHRTLRWLLPALTVLLLFPNPGAGVWATTYSTPAFFTTAAFRNCLAPGEIVLPMPTGQGGQANLWQVASSFRFRLAGGRLQTSPPSVFLHPDGIAQISVGYLPVTNQSELLRQYFAAKGVTAVIVDKRQQSIWTPALDRIAKRQDLGGVLFYRVGGKAPPGCG